MNRLLAVKLGTRLSMSSFTTPWLSARELVQQNNSYDEPSRLVASIPMRSNETLYASDATSESTVKVTSSPTKASRMCRFHQSMVFTASISKDHMAMIRFSSQVGRIGCQQRHVNNMNLPQLHVNKPYSVLVHFLEMNSSICSITHSSNIIPSISQNHSGQRGSFSLDNFRETSSN